MKAKVFDRKFERGENVLNSLDLARAARPGSLLRKKRGSEVAMMKNVFVNGSERYAGLYVATRSFASKTVLCAGKDPFKVFRAAQAKGAKKPVIVFIPKRDQVHVY
jgi:hypothetical protein